jgi:hypothetical protein
VLRVISCDLAFMVVEPAEVVLQVVAAGSAGRVVGRRLDIVAGNDPPTFIEELDGPDTGRLHVVHAAPGRLTVSYRGEIESPDHADVAHKPAPGRPTRSRAGPGHSKRASARRGPRASGPAVGCHAHPGWVGPDRR